MSDPGDQHDARTSDPAELALFAEAARRSSVSWVSYRSDAEQVRDRLVWHCWHDDALLLLSRPGEQHLPGLSSAARAEVALRSSDNGGLLVRRPVHVRAVPVDAPEWTAYAAALLAARLNHGPADATLEDWRQHAVVLRLDPHHEIPVQEGTADTLTS